MTKPASIGRVTSYAVARVFPRTNSTHTAEDVFLDYVEWCAKFHHVPLRDGVFRERFADLARNAGMLSHGDWADLVYLDIALGKP
jgi:hypothetical protein